MFLEAISRLLQTRGSISANYNYKPNAAQSRQLTRESGQTLWAEVVVAEDCKVTLTSK